MKKQAKAAEALEVAGGTVCAFGIDFTRPTDNGGGREPSGAVLPAVGVRWLDERELCGLVHDAVHFGVYGDVFKCPAYALGNCRRVMGNVSCAFHQASTAPVWKRAKDWKRQRDGGMLYDPEDKAAAYPR